MNSDSDKAATSFIIMDHVPTGCRLHPITDERHAPHLRPGEWVVLDTEDIDYIDEGEIYLVRQSGHAPELWQVLRPSMVFHRPNVDGDLVLTYANPEARECQTHGGSIGEDALLSLIVGKVAGLYETPAMALAVALS